MMIAAREAWMPSLSKKRRAWVTRAAQRLAVRLDDLLVVAREEVEKGRGFRHAPQDWLESWDSKLSRDEVFDELDRRLSEVASRRRSRGL
jgi:hypothetical protein